MRPKQKKNKRDLAERIFTLHKASEGVKRHKVNPKLGTVTLKAVKLSAAPSMLP